MKSAFSKRAQNRWSDPPKGIIRCWNGCGRKVRRHREVCSKCRRQGKALERLQDRARRSLLK